VRARRTASVVCLVSLGVGGPGVGILGVGATPAASAPAPAVYVVQAGDYLYGIAFRAGVTIDALLKANGIELDTVIIPGQKLTIPAGGHQPTPTTTSAPKPTTAPPPPTAAPAHHRRPASTYVVQTNDFLLTIAVRFGVSLDALLKSNGLTIDSIIVPGQKLAIPAGGVLQTVTGNSRIDLAISVAKAQIGKPYKFGFEGPDAFDCSGLIRFAFAKAGVEMLHYTLLQKAVFPAVAIADLRPGDVVFFHPDFSHEGLYLGNNLVLHAPAAKMPVQITWMPTSYITAAIRPIA
jgi:cell wall-associated NlpC family hydrolase